MKIWIYHFENTCIKKNVQFKHYENSCLKHDLWKTSSPTVSPRALCSAGSRVPWPLANGNFDPGCISVLIVMIPVRPETLKTPTCVTQHTPTFGPRTQSAGSHGTTPGGGVNRHLMLRPPKQPGPEFKFARGHGTRGRPQHRFFGLTVGHDWQPA